MKKLFIKPVNELIYLNNSVIRIRFSDSVVYRNFIINLDDNIILSIDDSPINYQTKTLVILNPLNIELNDKKTLSLLYKKLSYRVSETIQKKIINIEKEIFDLIETLSIESSCALEYTDSFDLTKVLQMNQVTLQEVKKDCYLECILTYIKTNCELYNYSIVLSFGLTLLLTKEELTVLENELAINQICIVDFYLNNSNQAIDYLLIDNDWNKL